MCNVEATAITSSTIVRDGWYVSGACLELVTNVALADDDGAGFQELPFSLVTNSGNPAARVSLLIPGAHRTGPGVAGMGIPLGQYLLQIKSCHNASALEKCKVLDEKYLIVPLGTPG